MMSSPKHERGLHSLARLVLLVAATCVLSSVSWASASNIYIAQNAAGSANGADCGDALPVSFFNAPANWGSGSNQIGPGTTVNLCGTFTAPAGASEYLVFQGSGSSGNPITLQCDSSAAVIIQAPYWSGAVVDLRGQDYLTLNGAGCTIQATANGTALANQQDNGVGIGEGSASSNVQIENWTIQNMYVHTCTEPVSNCTDEGGQNTYGIRLYGGSNVSINNNTVNNMKWAVFLVYAVGGGTSTGFNVYNNTISSMDHGVVFGDPNSTASVLSSSNCSSAVYNNDFSNMQPWDAADDLNHHDAIHIWANDTAAGAKYTGVCLYSNYFHGDAGATDNTVFGMESSGNGNYIFNNVINVSGYSACATGAIGIWTGSGSNSSNQHVFNNTISPTANCPTSVDFEQTSSDVIENNLILSGNSTYVYTDGTSGDLATADYNSYATLAGSNPFYGPSGCSSGASFATWRSGCGFDTHGQNTTIAVGSAPFMLVSGSAAIGAATNLTSLGITALDTSAPQTFGVGGSCGTGCVARPKSGAWDAGAYQAGGSSAPQPATGLTAVPH